VSRLRLILLTLTVAFLLLSVAQASALTLEVKLTGEGTGHVEGTLRHEAGEQFGEINCSNVPGHALAEDICSVTVEPGDRSSDLKATNGPLSVFTGWETAGVFSPTCKGLTNPCSFIVLFVDATVTASFGSEELAPKVEFPAVEPPPLEPVQGVTDSEASFHGRVNPEGNLLKACRFEYLTGAKYKADGDSFKSAKQLPCIPSPAGIGEGKSPVDVQAEATELEPNTEYRVRLLAEKEKSEPRAVTGETTFTTEAAPPALSAVKAWSVSDTTATLAAAVNPRNSAVTDCHFEWGATESYGHTAPCQTDPGAGNAPVVVTAKDLSGLDPSTTYHFRVVAENGAGGPQNGEDATFVTRSSVVFPQRGYELVSHSDPNGISALPVGAAADGNRFAFSSLLPLPGSQLGGGYQTWIATRDPEDGSWTQRYIGPAHQETHEGGNVEPHPVFSADLSVAAWGYRGSVDPDDQNGANDLYRTDVASGAVGWFSRDPAIPAGTPQTDPVPVAGTTLEGARFVSADGSRVYFVSRRNLLPADATDNNTAALYEWRDGQLSLVSIAPESSTGFTQEAALGSFSPNSSSGNPVVYGGEVSRNAVSPDGSRVAFEVGLSPLKQFDSQRLFVRVDGNSTVEASAPAPGAPPITAPKQVNYWGADAETKNVFFTSSSPLTPDSSAPDVAGTIVEPAAADLYRYTVPLDGNPANGHLIDLTPHVGGAGVVKVLWVSDDGRRVYFTSSEALTPDANPAPLCKQLDLARDSQHPQPGPCNVYLAELEGPADDSAQLSLIATGQASLGKSFSTREKDLSIAANPDGSTLAFVSPDQLVPGRRTGGGFTVSDYQLYVYQAGRDELSCASCPADGSVPAASADLTPIRGDFIGARQEVPHIRNVAADGVVFFQTATPLLAADTNQRTDVYEWRGGRLHLITSGADPSNDLVGDATAGSSTSPGATVFFSSSGAYVPGVQPGVDRIYAARVGGGFKPPLPTPPCGGEDCKPVATAQPNYATPATAMIEGRGNVVEPHAPRCAKGKVKRKGRCVAKHRKRAHRRAANHDRRADR
jgi:hypothetical protein